MVGCALAFILILVLCQEDCKQNTCKKYNKRIEQKSHVKFSFFVSEYAVLAV